jgi:hypothetical protein
MPRGAGRPRGARPERRNDPSRALHRRDLGARHHPHLPLRALLSRRDCRACARLPTLLREARERDDLSRRRLRTRHGYVASLAADRPDRAQNAEAIARWSTKAFYMQHYYALALAGETSLYADDPAAALQVLRERQPALEHSRPLRVHHLRIEWLHLSRPQFGSAKPRDRPGPSLTPGARAEPSRAASSAKACTGPMPWPLRRASIAALQGHRPEAARSLALAGQPLRDGGHGPYAAATRRRLGSILGGEAGRAPRTRRMPGCGIRGSRTLPASRGCLVPGRFGEEK